MAGCKCKNGGKVRNPGCGCGGKVANPRKRRNPVHAASEDYKLGLIQGALERGKLPPPSSSSADLKRGYTDGHKVAKAMPAARSEALGVLKATGSHLKAGESLYEAAKGSKNATLSQNPRSSVANVLAGIARKHLDFDTLDTRRMGSLDFREVAVWSVKSALEDAYRAGSGGREPPTSLIAGLARKHLDFETLATRRMDSLDFREVAVWSVKSALEEAYRAGQRAAKSGQATVRNPRKHRNPKEVTGQDVHDAYYRLYQALPAHTDEVTLRALARELGVSPDSVPFTGSSLYTVGGRVYPMLSKEDLLILRQGPTAKANPRKHRNPMSAAARKHLAHEKSEERSFASLMSKMPQGETVMLGKHRVRKLGKGYVVVDGVRLTTTQAAAKIHRGK